MNPHLQGAAQRKKIALDSIFLLAGRKLALPVRNGFDMIGQGFPLVPGQGKVCVPGSEDASAWDLFL